MRISSKVDYTKKVYKSKKYATHEYLEFDGTEACAEFVNEWVERGMVQSFYLDSNSIQYFEVSLRGKWSRLDRGVYLKRVWNPPMPHTLLKPHSRRDGFYLIDALLDIDSFNLIKGDLYQLDGVCENNFKEINNMAKMSELPPTIKPQKPIKIVHKISQHKLNEALRFIGIDVDEYRLDDMEILFYSVSSLGEKPRLDYEFTFVQDVVEKEEKSGS